MASRLAGARQSATPACPAANPCCFTLCPVALRQVTVTTPANKTAEITSAFMRMTMSNIPPKSPLLWQVLALPLSPLLLLLPCCCRRCCCGLALQACGPWWTVSVHSALQGGQRPFSSASLCVRKRTLICPGPGASTQPVPPPTPHAAPCRIHFVFVVLFVAWTCQLLIQYSKVRAAASGKVGREDFLRSVRSRELRPGGCAYLWDCGAYRGCKEGAAAAAGSGSRLCGRLSV